MDKKQNSHALPNLTHTGPGVFLLSFRPADKKVWTYISIGSKDFHTCMEIRLYTYGNLSLHVWKFVAACRDTYQAGNIKGYKALTR